MTDVERNKQYINKRVVLTEPLAEACHTAVDHLEPQTLLKELFAYQREGAKSRQPIPEELQAWYTLFNSLDRMEKKEITDVLHRLSACLRPDHTLGEIRDLTMEKLLSFNTIGEHRAHFLKRVFEGVHPELHLHGVFE